MAWGCDLSYDYVKINAGELPLPVLLLLPVPLQ
jgi:hypothetical protein